MNNGILPEAEWYDGTQFRPGSRVNSLWYKSLPWGLEAPSDGRFNVSSSIIQPRATVAFDYFGGYKLNAPYSSVFQRPALKKNIR